MSAAALYLRLIDVVNARLKTARAAVLIDAPWVAYPHEPGQRDRVKDRSVWLVGAEDDASSKFICEVGQHDRAPLVAAHIAANDPATVIRMCERDLKVLKRHQYDDGGYCSGCGTDVDPLPCPEVRDLAEAYEVSVE